MSHGTWVCCRCQCCTAVIRVAIRRESDEDECRNLHDGMVLVTRMNVTCAFRFANGCRYDFRIHKRFVQRDLFVFGKGSFHAEEQKFVTEDLIPC